MKKYDYTSAKDAHIRIDDLEESVENMSDAMEKLAEHQQKTTQQSVMIKWILVGGIGFYVFHTVGLLGALGIVQKIV